MVSRATECFSVGRSYQEELRTHNLHLFHWLSRNCMAFLMAKRYDKSFLLTQKLTPQIHHRLGKHFHRRNWPQSNVHPVLPELTFPLRLRPRRPQVLKSRLPAGDSPSSCERLPFLGGVRASNDKLTNITHP